MHSSFPMQCANFKVLVHENGNFCHTCSHYQYMHYFYINFLFVYYNNT